MDFIKNINLVAVKVKDFSISELTQIVGFNYFVDLEDADNAAYLQVNFAVKSSEESGKLLKVSIKFNNVSGFKLDRAGQIIHLTSFEIEDMKNQGWDSVQRFIVKDYEDGKFELKCSSIEIVSVEDLYQ